MDLGLAGKVAVITGGTKGIGLQIARDFLYEGAVVIIVARNAPNDIQFDSISEEFSTSLYLYLCDVSDETAMGGLLQWILSKVNKVDIVIANVGNGSGTGGFPIPDTDQWGKSWSLNFASALITARTFLNELTKTKGSLLFISSIAGMEYIGAPIEYSTAKNALIAFAKSLSHRFAPNVRVNTVAPGNIWIENGTWPNKMRENPESVQKMLNEKVPLKRFGLPEEVSKLVLFLNSSNASFITGGCFVVDGGQTLNF